MTGKHSLASVAALFGEPSRAAMLLALLDGRALPAGELARAAKLSAAAASLHLAKLSAGGLLTTRSEGRHRYYALASEHVAHVLEALGAIATPPLTHHTLRTLSPERLALRQARSCYDHLAGTLAVDFARMLECEQRLQARDDQTYEVSETGARWFAAQFGIDVDALVLQRRVTARRCLDWTERRPHLAGALGAALLTVLLDRRWLKQLPNSRVLQVTPRGRDGLSGLGVAAPRREVG